MWSLSGVFVLSFRPSAAGTPDKFFHAPSHIGNIGEWIIFQKTCRNVLGKNLGLMSTQVSAVLFIIEEPEANVARADQFPIPDHPDLMEGIRWYISPLSLATPQTNPLPLILPTQVRHAVRSPFGPYCPSRGFICLRRPARLQAVLHWGKQMFHGTSLPFAASGKIVFIFPCSPCVLLPR